VNRTALAGPGLLLAANWGPAVTAVTPLRRRLLPALAGRSGKRHVALTYDDGPDPVSTPKFLELLQQTGRAATFFLLGEHIESNRELVRQISRNGHELAVHGWDHRCLALKRPGRITDELRRTAGLLEDIAGQRVQWYRPPYGVLTAEGLAAARRAGLRTVLWSAWGRDWSRHATPISIQETVNRSLVPGGTVLLHDTDRTSAPGSWRRTLSGSRLLLDAWAGQGLDVGPLSAHW
jgi:peptidoglycan/xylan/chitin deacetylase (PgdA/CDA1 family)